MKSAQRVIIAVASASMVLGPVGGAGAASGGTGAAVTREQFLVDFMTALHVRPAASCTGMFKDVPASDTDCGYVEEAATLGWVNGVGNGDFAPAGSLTRAQIAKIEVIALGERSAAQAMMGKKTAFTDDASIPAWARGYVAEVAALGLVHGYPSGAFRPNQPVTGLDEPFFINQYQGASAEDLLTSACPFAFRGVAAPTWQPSLYQSPAGDAALSGIAGASANAVEIVPTEYMSALTSSDIRPDPAKTATDASVEAAIRKAQALGLKVLLSPHVDVTSGGWRGSIDPAQPAEWFKSYTSFIDHYAAIAEATHVSLFSVGTELKAMTTPDHAQAWAAVIRSVRRIYQGPLTYGANAASATDEFADVPFWPLLNAVGLDAYFPVAQAPDASLAQLEEGWASWVKVVSAVHQRTGLPVVLTEIGYPNVRGSAVTPWTSGSGTPPDPAAQSRAYQAALATWSQPPPWFKGMFLWDWEFGGTKSPYSLAGTQALSVISQTYAGEASAPSGQGSKACGGL